MHLRVRAVLSEDCTLIAPPLMDPAEPIFGFGMVHELRNRHPELTDAKIHSLFSVPEHYLQGRT